MWHDEISLDLIMLSFRSVWPSSVDGELSDCSKSPIAIYAIILFRRSRSARSCYFDDRDVRDRVIFNWSVVRTPRPNSAIFDWSWVQFPGQIDCFRPVWFMAYVTRPHKWWIRVMGKKNLMGGKKRELTTLSVRLRWRGRLCIVGIKFRNKVLLS